jgi:hypothetical protein
LAPRRATSRSSSSTCSCSTARPCCARRTPRGARRALLATRTPVDLGRGAEAGTAQLRAAFAALVADHEEGAVLKADNGLYNDWCYPWVKVGAFLWADGGGG